MKASHRAPKKQRTRFRCREPGSRLRVREGPWEADGRDADRGRQAESPSEIPAKGWRDIALRVKREASEDNVSIIAAGRRLLRVSRDLSCAGGAGPGVRIVRRPVERAARARVGVRDSVGSSRRSRAATGEPGASVGRVAGPGCVAEPGGGALEREQGHVRADRVAQHRVRRKGAARVLPAHRRHAAVHDGRHRRGGVCARPGRSGAGSGAPSRATRHGHGSHRLGALAHPRGRGAGGAGGALPIRTFARAAALALGDLGLGNRHRGLVGGVCGALLLRVAFRQLQQDVWIGCGDRHSADLVPAVRLRGDLRRRAERRNRAPDGEGHDHGCAATARPPRRPLRGHRRRHALRIVSGAPARRRTRSDKCHDSSSAPGSDREHPRFVRSVPGHRRRQRGPAGDPPRSGRRHVRAAVDRRRVLVDAGLVDLGCWLAVGSVRPQARLRRWPDRLCGRVRAVRRRAQRRDLDRGARTAGCRRRAAGSQLSGAHHRQLRRTGAGQSDRHVDRLDRHLVHPRPARRWRAGRRRILALGVCHQRPSRRGHAVGARTRAARGARDASATPSISSARACARSGSAASSSRSSSGLASAGARQRSTCRSRAD